MEFKVGDRFRQTCDGRILEIVSLERPFIELGERDALGRFLYTFSGMKKRISAGFLVRLEPEEFLTTGNWSSATADQIISDVYSVFRTQSRRTEILLGHPNAKTTAVVTAKAPCSCGRHDVDPGSDRYAQHNDWVRAHSVIEDQPVNRATISAKAVGFSARRPLVLACDQQWEP